mmetsp:Transcript_7334/g.21121  ORF Transcript_7334/g.21121 Transcript_7334/m.21121 type:complete len:538 (+) Transcript_7334:1099-2712(+)
MAPPVGSHLAVGIGEELAEERQVQHAVDVSVVESYAELLAQQLRVDALGAGHNATADVVSARPADGKFLWIAEIVGLSSERLGVAAFNAVELEPVREVLLLVDARGIAARDRDTTVVVNGGRSETLGGATVTIGGEDGEGVGVLRDKVTHHADEVIRALDGIEHSDSVSIVGEVVSAFDLGHQEEGLAPGVAVALEDLQGHLAQLCTSRRGETTCVRSAAVEDEAALLAAGLLGDYQSDVDQLLLGLVVEDVVPREEPQHLRSEVGVRLNAVQEGVELLASADDLVPFVGELTQQVAVVLTRWALACDLVLVDETVERDVLFALWRALGKEESLPASQQHLRHRLALFAHPTVENLSHDLLALVAVLDLGREARRPRLRQVAVVDQARGHSLSGRLAQDGATEAAQTLDGAPGVVAEGARVHFVTEGMDGCAAVGCADEAVEHVAFVDGDLWQLVPVPGEVVVRARPVHAPQLEVVQAGAVRVKEDGVADLAGHVLAPHLAHRCRQGREDRCKDDHSEDKNTHLGGSYAIGCSREVQ